MTEQQQLKRNPVILIHGIFDTDKVFGLMSAYLKQKGWPVYSINLRPNFGFGRLDDLALQLANYIESRFAPEQTVDLIGFSMGGIVSRYYLQRLNGFKRIHRYISISSPHYGTVLAYSLPLPGVVQMRPNSSFLQNLNDDATEILSKIQFTSLWTPFDTMIIPASSSIMPVGQHISFPVLLHRWMVSDYRVLNTIHQVLLQ